MSHLYEMKDCSFLGSDIAGMLLKSTGEFLDAGLQKSGNEFWESADDSTASDEIRWGQEMGVRFRSSQSVSQCFCQVDNF